MGQRYSANRKLKNMEKITQRKRYNEKNKSIQIVEEEVKCSLSADDTICRKPLRLPKN